MQVGFRVIVWQPEKVEAVLVFEIVDRAEDEFVSSLVTPEFALTISLGLSENDEVMGPRQLSHQW